MKHIIIGDVHGMYAALERLLVAVGFGANDTLVFTGDLVGRGEGSLAVVQLLYQLRKQVISVLGNHDLHALFMHASKQTPAAKTRLAQLLAHKQADELCAWVRDWPLMHIDDEVGYVVTHAGLYPFWTCAQAFQQARATKDFIEQQGYKQLSSGYGNTPALWQEDLVGWNKARFVINAFTRMRYLHTQTNELNFDCTCHPQDAPAGLLPWFAHPEGIKQRQLTKHRFFFGHWAALNGDVTGDIKRTLYALDTGCVWGGALTAYVMDTNGKNSEYVRVYVDRVVHEQDEAHRIA